MDLLDRPYGPPEPIDLRPDSAAAASVEVIVHVVGEIDICTEPALARCLAAQLQPARHLTSLVVDMSSVTYIGVQGFAALLTAATNAQHRGCRVLRGQLQPTGSPAPRRHRPGPHVDSPCRFGPRRPSQIVGLRPNPARRADVADGVHAVDRGALVLVDDDPAVRVGRDARRGQIQAVTVGPPARGDEQQVAADSAAVGQVEHDLGAVAGSTIRSIREKR